MALHRLGNVVCVLMLLAWNIREFGGEAAGTTDLDMQLSMIQEQAKTIQQLQARLQILENSNREAVASLTRQINDLKSSCTCSSPGGVPATANVAEFAFQLLHLEQRVNATEACCVSGATQNHVTTPPTSGSSTTDSSNSNTGNTDAITMTTVTDVPESTTPQCEGKWSDYIDHDDPSYGGGDKEHIYPAEIANFCPDGKLTEVKCVTVDSDTPYSDAGDADVSCDVDNGLVCHNTAAGRCHDYKISYFCSSCCT